MIVKNKPRRKIPRLSLPRAELKGLRRAGVKLADLRSLGAFELSWLTGIPPVRCKELVAISKFQSLRSVGPSTAKDLWVLGYDSIGALRGADPVEMYGRLKRKAGKRLDPCVEDVLRCAVAQAMCTNLPEPYKDWWTWRNQRGQRGVCLPDTTE